MASNRPFVVNPVLTAIAIAYINPAQTLIADKVLPRTPVGGEKFKWMEYPLAEGFTVPDTLVGRKGQVPRVEFSANENTSSTDDHALGDLVPVSDINAAKAAREQKLSTYDPLHHAAAWVTNLLMLRRETRVAAIVQNPANYAASRVFPLAGATRLDDPTSDPINVIKTALESTLIFRPNTITMGMAVWSKLQTHPKLVNAVKGNVTGQGIITREEFKQLFEIQNFYVGESYINTAAKGQAANLQRTWGKTIALNFIDPTARPEGGVTWGMTAEFGSRIATTFFEKDAGVEGAEEVRIGEKVKELVIAKDAGALITNAVA